MMEAETWLTAQQAKEKGLIDANYSSRSRREKYWQQDTVFNYRHKKQWKKQESNERNGDRRKMNLFYITAKINF